MLRLTNCHSEALAEESLKLSNSYRDSSVVSLLQNDRCKCISPPDGGARGGSSRRAELTTRHSDAFSNTLCRLLLRLTNCHSEAFFLIFSVDLC